MIRRFFRRRRDDGSTLSCEEVAEVLQTYLDSELDAPTARRVSAHLDECRRCGLEASVYRDLKTAIAHQADPPADSVDRLREFGHRLSRGEVDSVDRAGPS